MSVGVISGTFLDYLCGSGAVSGAPAALSLQQPPAAPPCMKEQQQTMRVWHHKQLQTISVPASQQPLLRRGAEAETETAALIGSELPQDRTVSMDPIEHQQVKKKKGGQGESEDWMEEWISWFEYFSVSLMEKCSV